MMATHYSFHVGMSFIQVLCVCACIHQYLWYFPHCLVFLVSFNAFSTSQFAEAIIFGGLFGPGLK